MAEVLGLIGAVYGTCKDVYYISRWIYRHVSSASKAHAELRELREQLREEFSTVACFACTFLEHDHRLDKSVADLSCLLWLQRVDGIYNRLKQHFTGVEAQLALMQDVEYSNFSRRRANTSANNDSDEVFIWELEVSEAQPNSAKAGTSASPVNPRFDVMWALKHRKRLEKLVAKVRTEAQNLLQLVPLVMATHPRYIGIEREPKRAAGVLSDTQATSNLKISDHLKIKKITSRAEPDHKIPDMSLAPGSRLELPDDTLLLNSGILVQGEQNAAHQTPVLVEYKSYPAVTADPDEHPTGGENARIRELALLLSSTHNPDFHTLSFRGYLNEIDNYRFAFVFEYPAGVNEAEPPKSLLECIKEDTSTETSLDERFHIALQLAKALVTFHADGWVHKSIRSESIVFFKRSDGSQDYEQQYLVNFEYSRPDTGATQLQGDALVESDVYRHPDRLGQPIKNFEKTHDIYALGVVLLEIGLWQPALSIFELANGCSASYRTIKMAKNGFLKVARKQLRHTMGLAYSSAVCTCLSGELDTSTRQGNFGLMVLDKVVQRLEPKMLSS